MEILFYCVGIDISKDKFDCCISYTGIHRTIKVVAYKKFANNVNGFNSFNNWLNSKTSVGISIKIIMEATGVYYESLAHYIYENTNHKVSVVLPVKAKFYFKSLDVKTKTDKLDSKSLAQYGLERHTTHWEPASNKIREIKQLSRQYRDLKISLNREKNRLHAKQRAYKTAPLVIKCIKQNIKLMENQCLALEVELKNIVLEDEFLNSKLEKLCSIPGIGFITAISIVGETNGFKLIRNAKQLASYAGLDISHNMSGNKTGKSRISKKGNKYIRQAIYMPALSASKRIETLTQFYNRINLKNKCKKIGLVAVSRKLLILTYTLWKKDEYFQLV